MKVTAKKRIRLNGRVYKSGDILDISEQEAERLLDIKAVVVYSSEITLHHDTNKVKRGRKKKKQ